jgi:hypothetical protein
LTIARAAVVLMGFYERGADWVRPR